MHSRFFRIAFTALTATGLSGCVQMTRHSNTLVFGTNTSFGVKVGADATSTPGITVGYSRQEAVVMPLVANTANVGELQAPCPQVVAPGTSTAALSEVCVLRGKDGADVTDAYSVLASFGTKYNAGGSTDPKVGGEISQYFATGLAARTLARSGAATVASGDAAAATAVGAEIAIRRVAGIQELATKVSALADSTAVAAAMTAIDGQLGGAIFSQACAGPPAVGPQACAAALRADPLVATRSPSQIARAIAAF